MGQTAADRPAVADLHVADLRHRLGQQGAALADQRRGLDGALSRHGAYHEVAVVGPNSVEATDLVEVDEIGGPHETKVQERDETLPAGKDLRLLTVLAEQGQRFVQ